MVILIREKYKRIENRISKTHKYIKKEFKDDVFRPVVKIFSKLGLTPNQVSLLSLVISLVGAGMLFKSRNWFLVLILLGYFLDGVDGALARYRKMESKLGRWIEYLFDKLKVLVVMTVVAYLSSGEVYFWLMPGTYLFVSILYSSLNGKRRMIYVEFYYYIILYFSFAIATGFGLFFMGLNFLIFVIYMCLKNDKE